MKRPSRIVVCWLVAALLKSTGVGHGVLLNDGPAQALSYGFPDSWGRLLVHLVDLDRTPVVRPTAIAERVEPRGGCLRELAEQVEVYRRSRSSDPDVHRHSR